MIAASAAWSTSVTKSLVCLAETRTDSTSSAARLMMVPARRAALMATLSMGWSVDDMNCEPLRGSGLLAGPWKSGKAGPQAIRGGDNRGFYRFTTSDTVPARLQCKHTAEPAPPGCGCGALGGDAKRRGGIPS